MNNGINDYQYLWKEEKTDWVLVNTEYGYAIVNKLKQIALSISDDTLEMALIDRMLTEGKKNMIISTRLMMIYKGLSQ